MPGDDNPGVSMHASSCIKRGRLKCHAREVGGKLGTITGLVSLRKMGMLKFFLQAPRLFESSRINLECNNLPQTELVLGKGLETVLLYDNASLLATCHSLLQSTKH